MAPGDDEEKPKNASVPKDLPLAEVTLGTGSQAARAAAHGRQASRVGRRRSSPPTGRIGPYVKAGKESRSLPADIAPLDVTLEQALYLLAQPKTRGRGRAARPSRSKCSILRPSQSSRSGSSPAATARTWPTAKPTPLSPAISSPRICTFEQALNLLAERAAKGPPPKNRRAAPRKKAAKKKGA